TDPVNATTHNQHGNLGVFPEFRESFLSIHKVSIKCLVSSFASSYLAPEKWNSIQPNQMYASLPSSSQSITFFEISCSWRVAIPGPWPNWHVVRCNPSKSQRPAQQRKPHPVPSFQPPWVESRAH